VKIACIGGGPAGLYLGILVKRSAPEHEVVIYERNRPDDTFGFGVVFSDATLGNLAAADPESHAEITARFARWDDIEIHTGPVMERGGLRPTREGVVLRSTGHGFCGLERKQLLQILQARARALGVRVEFEHEVRSLDAVSDADLVVGCDGVASWVRDALAAELRPDVDVRPNKFVWLGSTVPYDAFTFIFKPTPYGLFRVHAYRYHERGSTFIVECREDTWRAAGLANADEDRTVAVLEDVFAAELAGHRLIKNRSIWRNFPTVRCGRWHAGNVVLMGDAAHTAHFSIGSGTKLAMEDAIALRDELLGVRARGDVPAALAAYEARRRPDVEALQAAAQASLEWFEGTERYMAMPPVQRTYSLMTRSLRVSHASVERRDPHLARGVERLLADAAGVSADPAPAPHALPFALGDRRVSSRIVVTGPAADEGSAGATLRTTPVGTWRGFGGVARGDARFVTPLVLSLAIDGATQDAVLADLERAAATSIDVLVLDPGDDAAAIEQLPALLTAARPKWRPGGWLGAAVRDRPHARAAVIGHAAQLARAGADLLLVSSAGDDRLAGARLPAAVLADRLRNELSIATAIVADNDEATLADLDAAIAAGRADLVVVSRMPAATRRT
jgi:2-polyprenyl-6-methoxyphenol hydroxylase-like FAD-dependent oxidoreductase